MIENALSEFMCPWAYRVAEGARHTFIYVDQANVSYVRNQLLVRGHSNIIIKANYIW